MNAHLILNLCITKDIVDSFLLFKGKDQITHFQNYLQNKHTNIKFTCERENNRNLAF